jgi:plastocyanin
MDPVTIRVKQGDMVTLKIDTDESGEFHLHGYDIEQQIEENKVSDFYFVADATGRFRITLHPIGQDGHNEEETEGHHGHESKGEGADIHGEIFMSEVLRTGDTFSFLVTSDFPDQTIPFHSHLYPEVAGSIIVSHDGPESDSTTIQVKDLSAHPHEVTVRPGTTIVWKNAGPDDHMIASGFHSGHVNSEGTHAAEKDGHAKHDDGEEIALGFLEVGPR